MALYESNTRDEELRVAMVRILAQAKRSPVTVRYHGLSIGNEWLWSVANELGETLAPQGTEEQVCRCMANKWMEEDTMAAEVKVSLTAAEHQALRALLKFAAKKIDEAQFKAVLATLGYPERAIDQQLPLIAERLALAIE